MVLPVKSTIKLENGARIEGLPHASAFDQPISLGQILAARPDFFPPDAALLSTVTTAFPAITAEHANKIAIAARWASLDTALLLTAEQIVELLGRSGTLIYDFMNSFGLHFQDAAETQPVTADGQNMHVVRPWKGTNKFVADAAYTIPTASKSQGALFADSMSFLRLQTRRTDIRLAMTAMVTSPTAVLGRHMYWGDSVSYDYSPAGSGSIFDTIYAAPAVLNADIFLNNVPKLNAELTPLESGLLTVRTTANTAIGSIADDRGFITIFFRSFYGRRKFDLLSSEVYSLDETKAINRFALQYTGLV